MVPATDVIELMNNLEVLNGFDVQDEAMHIKRLFSENVREMRFKLIKSQSVQHTLFVVGQSGTGKTTALTFLPDAEIKQKFAVLHVKPSLTPELNRSDDGELNIANVLVNIANTIFQDASSRTGEKFIIKHAKNFLDLFKTMTGLLEINETRSGETGEEIGLSLLKWITRLDLEKHYHRQVREYFKGKIGDLVQALQDVIFAYETEVVGGKPLLLIIDDWEKLRDPKALENIFLDGISDLMDLECRKVISLPVSLSARDIRTPTYLGTFYFINKVLPNPAHHADDQHDGAAEAQKIQENFQVFREIVQARIGATFVADMVAEEVLDIAVRKSGGIIRQYLSIMAEAATKAGLEGAQMIRNSHVEEACRHLVTHMAFGISLNPRMQELLSYVKSHHACPPKADLHLLEPAITNNYIVFNKNGQPCYHINPLLEEMIPAYGNPPS